MTGPVDPPTTTPGPTDGARGDTDALSARFRLLADQDFEGYCPVYDRLARRLAADPEAMSSLLGLAPVNRTPVLALAAVHHLVLAERSSHLARIYRGEIDDDPWPLFRELVVERRDEIRHLMSTRSIQTNEVGRSAALLPGLAHVARHLQGSRARPPDLALVELGPSAGLNLLLDRFHVRYTTPTGGAVAEAGPADSPVRLGCELRGERRPPIPSALPLVDRVGLDIEPIDVTVDDECRWLSACVWPAIPDRPERLAAAIAMARQTPPHLRRGDASTDLEPLLRSLPDAVVPVVVATWVLAYLGPAGRQAVRQAVDAVGGGRDVALLTAEVAHVTPWVPAIDESTAAALAGPDGTDGADGTVTVLGLRTWRAGVATDQALAVMHPHGRWLGWLAEGSP